MLALDLADYMPIAGWAHAIYHSVPIDGHTVQGLKLQVARNRIVSVFAHYRNWKTL